MNEPKQNGSCGGGRVGIYIQNHLILKRPSDLERDEIERTAVKIMLKKGKNIFIFVMFRPPYLNRFLTFKV